MIDGSDIVVMNKCTEIWALYDEMQDELKVTMTRAWQLKWTNEWWLWKIELEFGKDIINNGNYFPEILKIISIRYWI